jgi:dTDP-glucose 4,6-dehydratase
MCDTIILGTRRALEFARTCGAGKFLLTSSGAVYGKQPPNLSHVPEEYLGGPDTTSPLSAYAEGKRVAELLSAAYANQFGLQVKIARCFAFVGPHLPLDTHFAIGNFILDGLKGGSIRVKGDGTPHRSYMYCADLAIWLWTILFQGASCRPYNVGSDDSVTIGDVAFLVADRFSPKREVQIMKKSQPGKEVERYVPSVWRAGSELKLRRTIELPEAIEKTIGWIGCNHILKNQMVRS